MFRLKSRLETLLNPSHDASPPQGFLGLVQQTALGCADADIALHAAAMAYYTMLSLAPLVLITVGIAGIVIGQSNAAEELVATVDRMLGSATAEFVQGIIGNSLSLQISGMATLIGIGVGLYTASLMFYRLQISLNTMWGIPRKKKDVHKNILAVVRIRLISAIAVISIGLFLLVLLGISALWAIPQQVMQNWLPGLADIPPLLGLMFLTLIPFTLLFAIVFKFLPEATVSWRDVWPGAALTALAVWISSHVVVFFLSQSWLSTVYGVAGSLVVILILVYWLALIVLVGAKFTQVFANIYGTPIDIDTTF